MTANVTTTVEERRFYETHIAYRLALIHSIAVQTYNLNSKSPTQTHQLHHLASRTATPLRHTENQQFYCN